MPGAPAAPLPLPFRPGAGPVPPAGRFRLRPSLLPLVLLLLALSALFLFGGDRAHFYRFVHHENTSSKTLLIAENLSFKRHLLLFHYESQDADGARYYPRKSLYSRFPLGGYALVKLAALPFGEYEFRAKIYASRLLLLLLLSAAAVLAYHALARITGSRWDALTATLLTFSSYYLLYYSDMISSEASMDIFGAMLAFHGMVIFTQEGRFRQLLVKSGAALLLGWHVYAFLLPFLIFGITAELLHRRRSLAALAPLERLQGYAVTLRRSRYLRLGIVTLLLGIAILAFNFGNEYFALDGAVPLPELPSVFSALRRTSTLNDLDAYTSYKLEWDRFLQDQLHYIGQAHLPYAMNFLGLKDNHTVTVLGILALAVCLAGLVGIRRRPELLPLLATLTVSGFCWTIPLRRNIVQHDYESVFYIGIPLAAFALTLLYLRRCARVRLSPLLALAALAVFIASASAMAGVGQSRADLAIEAEQMADYAAIRELVDDHTAVHLPWHSPHFYSGGAHWAAHYFLAGKSVNDAYTPGTYLLLPMREDTPALLTPDNRHIFLYDGTPDALYDTQRLGAPVIASDWQVYLRDGRLTYVSPQCAHRYEQFYLHLVPQHPADLDAGRQAYGYNNDDFHFNHTGVILNDVACVIERPLPDYAIAAIRTGQYDDSGRIWGAEYRRPASVPHPGREPH